MLKPANNSANYTPSGYREVLRKQGFALSYTMGVSMRPLIWTGKNYVEIVPVEREPAIDDILLFEQMRQGKTRCILHRLIEVRNDDEGGKIYLTRGDNCLGYELIRREDIIGKVSKICRRNSDWKLEVTDKNYLRYVHFWNAIWPLRKIFYRFRAVAAKVYHIFVKRNQTEVA